MQVYSLFLAMIVSVLAQTLNAQTCSKSLDLVFAVDTTSSQTSNDFEAVKLEVKKIASDFTIDQFFARLALVSIAKTVSVIVDFDAVKSLSDFDAALKTLSFSTDTADLAEGIKVARDSIMVKARKNGVPIILVVVKDRRSPESLVYDSSILSRIGSEAQLVKSLGAKINALGIGGLWNTKELEALYGTDYLMFKDKDKALPSFKSFNHLGCKTACPLSGKSFIERGMCLGSQRHVITERISQVKRTATLYTCRREIDRDFHSCSDDKGQRCNNFIGERKVGSCQSDNTLTVTVTLHSFHSKKQKCETTTRNNKISCGDVDKCPDQIADIIIVVDRSGSIGQANFPLVLEATADLIRYLNIGPNNVRVGIISFGALVHTEIELGSDNDKNSLLNKILKVSRVLEGSTETHSALERAREQFNKRGRSGVGKYVFLITDGKSRYSLLTFQETKLLKDVKVDLYCIGVFNPNIDELTTMTAPESYEKMILITDFFALKSWSEKFSKELCHKTAPPNAKLCDENVFIQSVSKCESTMQFTTAVSFAYDKSNKCVKSTQTQESFNCRSKCISPTDGSEYTDGSTWISLCYEFKCEGTTPKVLSSKCIAANGTCRDIGSPPFKCRDHASNEIDNCQCASNGSGKAYLVNDS